METETEFEVATWNQIYAMLLSQAEKIRQSGFKPDVIVGVKGADGFPPEFCQVFLKSPVLLPSELSFTWTLPKPETSQF